jgi:transcriptional regulator with XRE-family HTH domain
MEEYSWYKEVLNRHEKDFDYILEEKKIDITESICKIMQESNITRKQLAEKMETSPASITKFLNGNANFTLKTLIKFSICLERDLVFSFAEKRRKWFESWESFSNFQRHTANDSIRDYLNPDKNRHWHSAVDSGAPFNRTDWNPTICDWAMKEVQ